MTQEEYDYGDVTKMSIAELLDGIGFAFDEIRGDWTDPRSDVRRGREFLDELEERLKEPRP